MPVPAILSVSEVSVRGWKHYGVLFDRPVATLNGNRLNAAVAAAEACVKRQFPQVGTVLCLLSREAAVREHQAGNSCLYFEAPWDR